MTAALERATTAAADLLRCSLVVKLAVDLEDPRLARRAARQVITSARLLTGMDFPDGRDWIDSDDQDDDALLPEVADLLRTHRRDLEDEDLDDEATS